LNDERIFSNRDLDSDFHSNLPAFVYYFNDHHIYLINDKDVRHALLNSNKTVNVCALAKEKKQKVFTKDLIIDAPYEDWIYYNKANIYISENRIVHNNFYKLACAADVWNVEIRMSEKEGIVQFKYENGNMIIYNPDINAVIETIETIKVLDKNDDDEFIENKEVNKSNKYVFKNKKILTLARENLDKEFGGMFQLPHLTQQVIISFTLNLFVIMLFLIGLISLKN
jgi:hypothetical protein